MTKKYYFDEATQYFGVKDGNIALMDIDEKSILNNIYIKYSIILKHKDGDIQRYLIDDFFRPDLKFTVSALKSLDPDLKFTITKINGE